MRDAIDDALAGEGHMPEPLREFLLATGERGIGWQAVYGDEPLTVERFELLTWMQSRVALAATEDGRKQLARDRSIERAINATEIIPPPVPFDPETMSAAEVADWLARYGGGTLH